MKLINVGRNKDAAIVLITGSDNDANKWGKYKTQKMELESMASLL